MFLLIVGIGCSTDSLPEIEPPKNGTEWPVLLPDGFDIELYAEGLDQPTSIEFPPDGSDRLFVNELTSGLIWIIENGERLPEPFIDLKEFYPDSFPFTGSRGLIGLEFHPDYQTNRYLYITLALPNPDDAEETGFVVRITDQNNRGTDIIEILSGLPSMQGHQVQNVRFGPDGMLYLSVGDAYRPGLVQDVDEMHGKILRLTEEGEIPGDNQFGEDRYTFALGFRNAYDLVFDDEGRLFVADNGDVGMDSFRLVEPGSNHGWPVVEGFHGEPDFTDPLHVWPETVVPTGMHVYGGDQFPYMYQGKLFQVLFGVVAEGPDSSGKRIQVADVNASGHETTVTFSDFAVFEFEGMSNPIDVAEGPDGSLYVADFFQGKIFRISYQED
jgi:glucose/arabinose dehydrogenase